MVEDIQVFGVPYVKKIYIGHDYIEYEKMFYSEYDIRDWLRYQSGVIPIKTTVTQNEFTEIKLTYTIVEC